MCESIVLLIVIMLVVMIPASYMMGIVHGAVAKTTGGKDNFLGHWRTECNSYGNCYCNACSGGTDMSAAGHGFYVEKMWPSACDSCPGVCKCSCVGCKGCACGKFGPCDCNNCGCDCSVGTKFPHRGDEPWNVAWNEPFKIASCTGCAKPALNPKYSHLTGPTRHIFDNFSKTI